MDICSADGSFTKIWWTNILFTIARSIACGASEAARRHLLALQSHPVLQEQALHARMISITNYLIIV